MLSHFVALELNVFFYYFEVPFVLVFLCFCASKQSVFMSICNSLFLFCRKHRPKYFPRQFI